MLLRTPLYDWHRSREARLVEFGGWEMPVQYTTIIDEHQAVRSRAGLFDISHMGRLVFEGSDAVPFLQHLFTNNVETMKPGQVRYGLVCNEQGGILDDVLVYRLEPFWMMVVNASNRVKIVEWIAQHKGSRQVTVTDRTMDWGMVAVQGPRAIPSGDDIWELRTHPGKLKYYYGQAVENSTVGGSIEVVSRTGYTGEDGFEVIVDADKIALLVETFTQEGSEIQPCGLGARDTLRLEAAMPLYGHELSEEIDPFQAGLSWAVKLNKGDFLGRKALTQRKESVARTRIGLELAGRRIAREGASVVHEGKVVGEVTSGTFSPTLSKALAMAYVDPVFATAGTTCEIDIRGKRESATVVPLPFYSRKKD